MKRKSKRDYEQLAVRAENTKVELSKELDMSVARQELVMNNYLKIVDEIHLACSSLQEEMIFVENNKRIKPISDRLFENVSKLKDFEDSYTKTNRLIYALSLSNKKRGDTLLQFVERLKFQEKKIEQYEKELGPLRISGIGAKAEDQVYVAQGPAKPQEEQKEDLNSSSED